LVVVCSPFGACLRFPQDVRCLQPFAFRQALGSIKPARPVAVITWCIPRHRSHA
jgi:hypothetical protein